MWHSDQIFLLWSPLNSITVQNSSSYLQTYRICKAQITSEDFTYAVKAKEAVCSAPLVPRNPNYNSDTVCHEGREWRIAKSLENPERGNLLLWKRKALPPRGCRVHNQALNLTWYEQLSWCTISVHPRAQTPKQDCSARRLRRGRAEHPQAERTPWEGRGSPQIKMDAVSQINLRSGSACAGKRAALLSSETSSEACKHGARTGLGEGARSSLAQSANYIIGTKKRISLGLVWPSGALWRQLTDVETF